MPLRALTEICAAFLKLGLISFGGPVAHMGYLRDEFVAKRQWLDDAAFADLMALCQFLPGPGSSQLVFALGMRRAGLPGALAASLCFTLPSAILMILFAYGVARAGDIQNAGWIHGLKLTSVAVVAQAVWGMGRRLCPDRARITLCLVAAAFLLIIPGALWQIVVIAVGALAGWMLYRRAEFPITQTVAAKSNFKAHVFAGLALIVFAVLLFASPLIAAATGDRRAEMFDSFYRSGALVFGGGHVVLPLLRSETVPRGWLTDDQFLAGYGAVQAMPGPLSTFAGYLGTIISKGPHAWLDGLWGLFAIFLPAWLLIGGALPFWVRLRSRAWTQAALQGANAAVVGVLLAALCSPVFTEAVEKIADVPVVLIAFGLLEIWRLPPWLIVIGMAAAGQWLL